MEKLTFERLRDLHDQAIKIGVEMVASVDEDKAETLAEAFGDMLADISDLMEDKELKDITTNKDEIKVLKRQAYLIIKIWDMLED